MIKLCILYLIVTHLNPFDITPVPHFLYCLRQGLDIQPYRDIVIEAMFARSITQEDTVMQLCWWWWEFVALNSAILLPQASEGWDHRYMPIPLAGVID